MTFEQLRAKHPRLIYKNYEIESAKDCAEITYTFLLEPDILLRSLVSIPLLGKQLDKNRIEPWACSLGMVELISYWKMACPSEIVIEAGQFSSDQLRFWNDLLLHGLGEFFYRNAIDFTVDRFVTMHSLGTKVTTLEPNMLVDEAAPDLLLTSGGKDTAVTLGILKESDRTIQTMILNPTEASRDITAAVGIGDPIIIHRQLDPLLKQMNAEGYLNGHTPFSSYLAFLGSLVASIHGYKHVIVSNEQSANEGNIMYHGMEINHQYSKSYRFEQQFRQYIADYLGGSPTYFSFLRPLNDLQIGQLFAKFPEFHAVFRSCNVGSRENKWCGICAKCAFTYLVLAPFLSREQLIISFGDDFFQHPEIIAHIKAEVGLSPVKPFECVGTRDEARLALFMVIDRYIKEKIEVPESLLLIKSELDSSPKNVAELTNRLFDTWADTYNLPPDYLSLLRSFWERVHE